ncbi:hypothetical protein C1646_670174 [Rhizophagus diaphanus]|nr:hypothetical protein C1646_670174 [Rhizophagus diaphanus] [Rhizophagus sp. MUCL 43196]
MYEISLFFQSISPGKCNIIIENMVKGGELKEYCQTRWMTAFDCISSVLKCEDALKNNHTLFFNNNVLKHLIKDGNSLISDYTCKGFRNQVCRKVVYWAIDNIWTKMGSGENFSSKLIGQITSFRNKLPPYDDEFIPIKYYTVERWWSYVEQDEGEENFIQQFALKIFSIILHNAGCERIFSVMGWYMNKRRIRIGIIELLKLQEPQVIIEDINIDNVIDHGNKNFDLDKLLDEQFNAENE